MKLPLLFSVLLSITTAVQAEDLFYLKCDYKSIASRRNLKTDQVTEESKTGANYYKADIANSRIQGSYDTEWRTVDIVNGTAIDQEYKSGKNKFKTTVSYLLDLIPPGNMSFVMSASSTEESITIMTKGVCQKSDKASFERASTSGDN